jgi:hypothetical protein
MILDGRGDFDMNWNDVWKIVSAVIASFGGASVIIV